MNHVLDETPSPLEVDETACARHAQIVQQLREDPAAAALRLRALALADDAAAQLLYGQLLINGVGCAADPHEALHWFSIAAEAGLASAMNMIGRCHENGLGTPVDHALAAVWYRHAAQRDCAWAIYNHAHQLAHGRGVARDRAAAFAWFQRAAALGHARALHFLGQYHEYGWETPVDRAAAFDCYRRSAEGGDFRGQASHASVLVEQGRIDEALPWLRRSIATATPAYLDHLEPMLARSPHAPLRELARGIAAAR